MSKIYEIGKTAQEKIATGVNKLANTVKLTLGPKGKNVILDRKFTTPLITNDGVTIAKEFELPDTYENMGVKLIKEVCQKTNDLAGDGTTTAIVLAQKMLNEGLKYCNNGVSPILLNKGLNLAKEESIEIIKNLSKNISTTKEIEQIAKISSQDKNIGKLIGSAYNKLGKTGNILLQDSKTANTEIIFQEGMSFNKGFVSPFLCNNTERTQTNFEECYLLIIEKKITNFNELLPIFEQILTTNKPLLIICDDIDEEVLSAIIINKMRGSFNCCVVKSPMHADKKTAVLEDIAVLTNTKVFSNLCYPNMQEIKIEELGILKQAKITKDTTTIISKNINIERLQQRQELIKRQIENCQDDFNKDQLKQRLSNLSGGIATIYVGANTEVEQLEKKLRIEDAIASSSSAYELGIVAGGGICLLQTAKLLSKKIKKLKGEEKLAYEIFLQVLKEPIKQILNNCEIEPSLIISKIEKSSKKDFGYDALNNKFCNMISAGIIDPAKVTITALTNATSVATTMLTTQAIVTDKD